MTKQISILCNSPQCLAEITSGNYPELYKSDLFTCNLAYTHIRTEGRHLNIFSDRAIVHAFLSAHDWHGTFSTAPYNKVEHIINLATISEQSILHGSLDHIAHRVKESPLRIPASSAIGALFHSIECEHYDQIRLIGYNLKEWKHISNVKELKAKKEMFDKICDLYNIEEKNGSTYIYTKK